MQQNKYSFLPSNWTDVTSNQVALFSDSQCKKILSHCEKFLNSYIKYLVPPQECACEQLKRILQDEEAQLSLSENLLFTDDQPDVVYFAETPAKSPSSLSPQKPGTPKVCRFAEVADVVPIHQDAVIIEEEPSQALLRKVKPFKAFSPQIVTDSPRLPSPTRSVAFRPSHFQQPLELEKDSTEKVPTPIGRSAERHLPAVSPRPRYTTQVSTISQKSNTVSLYSCWPPPIGIILICILEVILYMANERKPVIGRYSYGNIADALIYDPARRIEVWRYITYLFVHIGLQHLLFNLGVQIFLGVILEMVHDRWRVLSIYFAGVLAGSLGTSLMSPKVKLAGASGGVYSLITAHMVTVILKWKHMQYPATQFLAFLIVIVTDMGTGIYNYSQNKIEDIGYTAHACGAFAGLLVGFPILRKLHKNKQIRWFQFLGLVVYFALIIFAATWNVLASDLFPKQLV